MILPIPRRKTASAATERPRDPNSAGFLGTGVEAEGTINVSSGTFDVGGRFKGHLRSGATIIVGEGGEVEADIAARVVTVTGKVTGSIQASEALEIKSSGRVKGDITTPVLIIEPGGHFEGQCHMPAADPQALPTAESSVPPSPPLSPSETPTRRG